MHREQSSGEGVEEQYYKALCTTTLNHAICNTHIYVRWQIKKYFSIRILPAVFISYEHENLFPKV